MNKNFMARISAIITDFQRNIRKAQRMAKTEIPDEIETQVDANISKFKRALNTAKAMAQRWREHTIPTLIAWRTYTYVLDAYDCGNRRLQKG